jgi:predicted HD phosphohydrolase
MRMTRAARAVRPSLLLAPRLPLRAAGTAAACRQFSAGSLNSHAEHQREVVDELRSLYEDDEYYTDALTQLSHGLQGAALAEQAGAEPSMVVAALLHDVGWKLAKTAPWLEETDEMVVGADADLTADCPDDSLASQLGILAFCGSGGASLAAQQAQHDTIGATFLRMRGVDEAVCTLVEGHVLAKRYLCYAEEGYYEALSPGSIATLRFQGGVMGPDEAVSHAPCRAVPYASNLSCATLLLSVESIWTQHAISLPLPAPHSNHGYRHAAGGLTLL